MIRIAVRALTLALIGLFVGLGVWQLQRLAWKNDLIARVERRLASPPVAPPPSATKSDEYTRITVTGRYVGGHDSYVQAVTELGGGFWVLTPIDTAQGRILVNRGFIPADRRGKAPPPAPFDTPVTGLLRLTEPGGGFLRANDPVADRWYSRDVGAIARAKGLGRVAPYFIDAGTNGNAWPRGGLTVVRFRNTHLIYALTWFAMAALLAFLSWRAMKRG